MSVLMEERNAQLIYKINNISNRLYNRGLAQANNRELTNAVSSLSKSLEFNKKNTQARNLLGLIYYELGQIGDSLKQWIISNSFDSVGNDAEQYITLVKNNYRTMESLNDAVKMYNQAIVYMKKRSEDIAAIQLKKALEINPKFLEANNLLTLCNIFEKDTSKIVGGIERSLTIDNLNKKALTYQQKLGVTRPSQAVVRQSSSQISRKIEQRQQRKKKNSFLPISEAISMTVGIVCTTLVIYILVIPSITTGKELEIEKLSTEISSIETKYNKKAEEQSAFNIELTTLNNQLNEENAALKQKVEIQEKVQLFNNAIALNSSGMQEDAAAALKSLDITTLPDEYKQQYENLTKELYPKVAISFYNKARTFYNTAKYDDSKAAYLNAIKYGLTEAYLADATYFLGRIAELQEDNDLAKGYYEKVVGYNRGTQVANAKARLRNL